ncbi:MAG: alpha/beta fold hydrolase, partial [Acidobacteriota bacterium]
MSTEAGAGPVASGQRIETLDVLRGFALLWIFVFNVFVFSGYEFFSDEDAKALTTYPADVTVKFLRHVFIENKDFSLFSFLFGIGFGLMARRAQAGGTSIVPRFLKRQAVLLGIGAFHGVLLWGGDILMLYAVLGLVMLPFLKRSNRTILTFGAIFYWLPVPLYALSMVVSIPPPWEFAASWTGEPNLFGIWLDGFANGDYPGVVKGNVAFLAFWWSMFTVNFYWPDVLGMFLFGLFVGRSRLLERIEADPSILRGSWLAWAGVIGIAGNVVFAILTMRGAYYPPSMQGMTLTLVQYATVPLLCFFYMAGLTWLFQKPAWQPRLRPFAWIGRMTLTCYLMQSLICIVVFYGIGGGLFGEVGSTIAVGVALVVYGLQVVFSRWWWSQGYDFGPVEWIWRCLTYGRVPIRAAATVVVVAVLGSVLAAPAIEAEPSEHRTRPYTWTTHDGIAIEAVRGTVTVPENRADPASRTIQLAYVRLPSTAAGSGASPGPPIVYLAGGPGASGIDSARGPRADFFLALREVADVVLLDQRGTGQSRPALICGKTWEHPLDAPLDDDEALDAIRDAAALCAEQMTRRGIDLSQYEPRAIADDVDTLRQALGVETVSLVATSFGTRLALETLRRHGARIDRAMLLGVVGPDHVIKRPEVADHVLSALGAGPDGSSLANVLRERLVELRREPMTVEAHDVLTGDVVPLQIGPADLQLAIVDHLGSTDRLLALREIAGELQRDAWQALADPSRRQRKRWLGHVVPYAVTCAAGASPARRDQIAAHAGSSLAGHRLDFHFPEVCAPLGVEPLDAEIRRPVRSDVPVLAISGSFDARTPPSNADEVLATLPNGAHLIIERAGHGDDLLVSTPEIARRARAFFTGASADDGRVEALPPWRRVPRPPDSLIEPVVETLHGVEITDPYRWLEDSRTPEARIWVRQQNAHTDRLLDVLPDRAALRQRLDTLFAGADLGRPWVRGERAVYLKSTGPTSLPTLAVRDGDRERTLIDPRRLPETNGSPLAIEPLALSADGELAAFGVRKVGAETIAVRFVQVDDGRLLADVLPTGRYFGVSIAPDGRGAYYAREQDDGHGTRVRYHRFGADPSADRAIFGEQTNQGAVAWSNLDDAGRYLVQHAVSGTNARIDVYLDRLEPVEPTDGKASTGHDLSTRQEVVSGVDAAFYGGVLGDHLVVHTTWQAPRGRVMVAPVETPGREYWREIVPEHEHAVIEAVFGAGGRLLIETLDSVRSRITIVDLDGRSLGEIPLPAPGSVDAFSGRFDDPVVFFRFSSFHLPTTIYRYDLDAEELSVWRSSIGGLDPDQVVARQAWISSADGTSVPVFLAHRKDLDLNGSNPTLITAYGGFGTALTPDYRPEAAWWVEQGGVWAVAGVRGGGELGRDWHQAAVREHKQRSIDDLIAVAEHLTEHGITRPERL